ncbi:MAG: thiamine phosphate synthase [Candidatus Dormibacteria bacterium]
MRIDASRLYLVIDARPDIAEAALRGGVDVVQLRDKSATDDELLDAGRELRRLCTRYDALFIVNDFPELAVRINADGVHLGQDDVSVGEARRVIGEDRLVGLSTHCASDIAAATAVDYLGVGPIHATPTKPGRPAVGLGLVAEARGNAQVPWFAIGTHGRRSHLGWSVAGCGGPGDPRCAGP